MKVWIKYSFGYTKRKHETIIILLERKARLIMKAEKLNNGDRKSGSCEAGFFYRRIGGTVYKIRVLTSENSTDTFSDKISHIISREVLTEKADYDKIELPQISQLPEGSSA